MKLAWLGSIIAQTYTDKMTISRYDSTVSSDGTTKVAKRPTPVYTDVPCRISFSQNDNPESLEDDANPIYLQVKLFCGVTVDLRKGDYIVAERVNESGVVIATYTGNCNEPVVYVTHKEAAIVKTGDA